MQPLDILPLHEPRDTEFSLVFTAFIKKKMKFLGWKKGDRMIVFRQGTGVFITKASSGAIEDLKAIQKHRLEGGEPDIAAAGGNY
jgi:hypothetical protein